MTAPECQIVSYGELADLRPLLASLRAQTVPPARVRIWHNGPRFDGTLDGVELLAARMNLGFGAGHNRLMAGAASEVVVVANPDLVLDPYCLARLAEELGSHPRAVAVGGALVTADDPPRVNAFGLQLSADLVGLNVERGRPFAALDHHVGAAAAGTYLGPSGALFAIHRPRWEALVGRPLFAESLFLYMEDVALWLRLRAAGGEIRFRRDAWARHAFSASVGQRSALKLYHVERNRLWICRALMGRAGALSRLPWTALRYAAYATQRGGTSGRGPAAGGLARAFARALRDGLWRPVPGDLVDYLAAARSARPDRRYRAPWRAQLVDPTRDAAVPTRAGVRVPAP